MNNIGVNFGLTSGVITTLGLITGLYSGTHSLNVIIGGVITIAIADSMSDAMGIHISKESEAGVSKKEVWSLTMMTLVSKALVSLSFLLPFLVFNLQTAIYVCMLWGMGILTYLSVNIARDKQDSILEVVSEHLGIAIVVIISTHYVGVLTAKWL